MWHTGLCILWCLPPSYAPPLPLLVCALPSSLMQLVIHSHTYYVLSGLCTLADALFFLWKTFPHSELRGLDKCHLSFKINLSYSFIQVTFHCWLSFLYTTIISLSLSFWRLFFFFFAYVLSSQWAVNTWKQELYLIFWHSVAITMTDTWQASKSNCQRELRGNG